MFVLKTAVKNIFRYEKIVIFFTCEIFFKMIRYMKHGLIGNRKNVSWWSIIGWFLYIFFNYRSKVLKVFFLALSLGFQPFVFCALEL